MAFLPILYKTVKNSSEDGHTPGMIMAEMKLQSVLFSLQKEPNITVIFLQNVSSCTKQFPIDLNCFAIGAVMHKIISNWCEFKQTMTMCGLFVAYD